jgi:hypothetical protein
VMQNCRSALPRLIWPAAGRREYRVLGLGRTQSPSTSL